MRPSVLLSVLGVLVSTLCGAGTAGGAPGASAPLGPDFLWGVSASGYQSEGSAPDSNWTRYVAQGKTEGPYLNSVDFYHRYPEDIARAKALGVKVYRIGVEWARVQPRPGSWDEGGLAFYDAVIRHIRAAGMRPMLTIDHWVYPGWEVDRGGWRNPQMVADWLANARVVVDRFAKYDPMWVTINEPVAYLLQETGKGGLSVAEAPMLFDKLVAAHRGAYDIIHARQPRAMVTSNVAFLPAVENLSDTQFIDRVADKLDYIGVDYYYGASLTQPPTAGAAQGVPWTSPIEPEGIYYALRLYARKFPGRPLYIVENGMPTDNGRPRWDKYTRAAYLRDTVYWLQRAKADGMNLIGYNYWSLTDNYEWGTYAPRFGLYTVDVTTDPTLTRKPTDAVPAYRQTIAAGGVPPGYRPTRAPAFCSLMDPLSSCVDPVTVPTR